MEFTVSGPNLLLQHGEFANKIFFHYVKNLFFYYISLQIEICKQIIINTFITSGLL